MASLEELNGKLDAIQTEKDNIKEALNENGANANDDLTTYADAVRSIASVKTVNNVEADENKNVQLDASNINIDDTAETKQTIKEVINTLQDNISSIEIPNSNIVNGKASGSLRTNSAAYEDDTYIIGTNAFAEGNGTKAIGGGSHAEGDLTVANGANSHTEGRSTQANGVASHAEGESTNASGTNSHAEGLGTTAMGNDQHVQGRRNVEDIEGKYAHIVGNGLSNTSRSNAHTIDWEGNGWFSGNIKVGGTSQDDVNAKTLATTDDVNNAVTKPVILHLTQDNLTNETTPETLKTEVADIMSVVYREGATERDFPIVFISVEHHQTMYPVQIKKLSSQCYLYFALPEFIEYNENTTNLNPNLGLTIMNNSKCSYQIRVTKSTGNATLTKNTFNSQWLTDTVDLPCLSTKAQTSSGMLDLIWMPTDPAQPANKKYVDENKYSTKTIINKITTDQTAGWTYSFGYKCDDLMVFLNGENLIGKESDTQTINDYSYTKGLTNGKCTSITFTNDFTIVTDDIIKLVLINPEENS